MKSIWSPEYNVFRLCMISARKKAKLTQAVLAKMLEKPQSFVAKYENGDRRLDVIEFLLITQAIGADPHAILKKVEQSIINTSCEGDL